ncbi:MAG: DNA modification methylase [Planctomycetota bacterium]
MQIRRISTHKINPAPYNPRKNLKPGDIAYEQLVQSLDSFGCVEPLVWNQRSGYLVGGHQRFKVLQARGDKTVDVSVVDLDEQQEKALNPALNKITGEWDEALLEGLLRDLGSDPTFDFGPTGFTLDEIDELLSESDTPEEVTPNNTDGPVVTQPGELITLGVHGEHRLLCGDVLDSEAMDRLMDGRQARVCHTDPPYGVSYDPRNRPGAAVRSDGVNPDAIRNDDLKPDQYRRWFEGVMDAVDAALIRGGSFYFWNAHRQFGLMHDLLTERKFTVRSTIVWAIESFSPGFGDYQEQVEFCLYGSKRGGRHRWYGAKNASTLWRVSRERRDLHGHPTQKPLELAERAIQHTTKRGDLVFDPFLGSGTTLIAAARLGRESVGLEIEPRYCDAVVRRYIALAGASAVSTEIAERYRAFKEVPS